MIKVSTLALAAGLALGGATLAHAEGAVTGEWNYKVGVTGTACTLTFKAGEDARGGDVVSGEKCPGGLSAVGHWHTMGKRLSLMSPSGSLVAILYAKHDGYVGKQIGGGRKVALSR